MKTLNYWLSAFALTGLLLSSSCQKEEIDPISSPDEPTASLEGEGNSIKLGERLENPYSVANMKKAWENLKSGSATSRVSGDEMNIEASHLYVKFKPKDDIELSLLKRDTTIELYTYPLDYEIAQTGDYYHDPAIPAGLPTFQYAAVKVNYKFPNVVYEVLEEIYIPEEAETSINGRASKSYAVEALVEEALRITGNLDEDKGASSNNRIMSDWRPAGTIRVWDHRRRGTRGDWTPVVGVEVRATRWFTTHTGITNASGDFSCDGTFNRPANYSIQWDRYHFSVRSGTLGQAVYNGPKMEGDWNLDLGNRNSARVDNSQQYYALIFQGAHDYYYGNRFGLSVPPQNSTWHPQVKIAADITERQNEKSSHAAMYARTGAIFPTIYVRRWEWAADFVYGTTTHELAHAAHWDMNRDAFRALVAGFLVGEEGDERVIESWAQGVEWQFAIQRYRNIFGNTAYQFEGDDYQTRTITGSPIYTSIAVDMIDNENQRVTRGAGSPNFPQDRVTGYTIQQIEQGLRGATSWDQWRLNMRNRQTNPTIQAFIDELFGNW